MEVSDLVDKDVLNYKQKVDWICSLCTLTNYPHINACEACLRPKPSIWSNLIKINDEEIILVPDPSNVKYIYKYNINTKKWTKFIKFPPKFQSKMYAVSFDIDTDKLYIYGRDSSHYNLQQEQVVIVDIHNHEFRFFKNNSAATRSGGLSTCIVVDGILHIIGGTATAKHDI